MAATPACLLPNDYDGAASLGPYPPQVDRDTLIPKAALTQLWTKCDPGQDAVQLAAQFTDLDSPVLNHRWVANNGVSNTIWLEDDQTNPEQGPHIESVRLQHSSDFGFDENVPNFTGVVSLFTTDAPAQAWAVDPNSVPPGEPRDLGLIQNPNHLYAVIEVRWTFEYLAELGEGVCQPAD